MTDIPTHDPPASPGDHAWVHDNLAAYLAEGLDAVERQRFDAHINACPDCFDAFTEARDADRHLQRTLSAFAPENSATFEDRISTHVREKTMTHTRRLFIRRTSYAAAACLALAATGVFANYAIHQNGRFNNPLSREMVAQADTADPEFSAPVEKLTSLVTGHKWSVASAANTSDGKTLNFNNAPMSAVLDEMSRRYDLNIVIQSENPSFSNVTLQCASPANAAEARSLLNTLLEPMNYRAVASSDGGKDILRILTVPEAKKLSIPVYEGADPSKIPATDEIVTAVIPLNHIPAVQLRNDLGPMLSADADVTSNASSNSIVVTDTATKVKRLTEIISKLDQQQATMYSPLATGRGGGATAGGYASTGGGGGGAGGGGGFGGGGGGENYKGMVRQSAANAESSVTQYRQQMASAGQVAISDSLALDAITGKKQSLDDVGFEFGANNLREDQLSKTGSGTWTAAPALVTSGNITINNTGSFNSGTTSTGGALDLDTDKKTGTIAVTGGAFDDSHESNVSRVEFGNLNTFNQAVPPQTGVPRANSHYIEPNKAIAASGGIISVDGSSITVAGKSAENADASAQQVAGSNMPAPLFAVRDSLVINGSQLAKNNAGISHNEVESDTSGGFDRPASISTRRTDSRATIPVAAPSAPPTGTTTQPSAPAAQPVPSPGAEAAAHLKIIRNGTLEFEVRSFDDTTATVTSIVDEEGGFVSSTSSEKLANGKVRGSIVVRVPPEHLDRFVVKLRALGELKGQQIAAQDVTKIYNDTDSELRGLRTMESRLLDLIKNGKGEVKDLIEAESKLGDTRIQIEKLEGELHYYNNLVSMATLTINAFEKDIQTPTAATEVENVNLSVETEEVEAKYQSARKILGDAKARIVESQLKNTDADHIAAVITADVPPDQADFVAAQLKQLGKIASFTRDRHQTTAGGEGAPAPHVQVEQKDTRFSISLYNLANLAPRETTVLTVAVRNVETSYKDILSIIRKEAPAASTGDGAAPTVRAMGRVINTNFNGQVPEQMTADIRAELRTDGTGNAGATGGADAILQAIRDSGEVLASSLSVNPDNTNSTAAKRGVQLRLVNIAAVPPKESETIIIAVRDVEASYKKALALLVKPTEAPAATPATPAPAGAKPEPTGRILFNTINGQQPEQMTADIRAEVRADQADAVLQALRDSGETLSNSSAQNPDPVNATASKEGVQLRLVNIIAVPARETQHLRLVASDVSGAYNKLLAALQTIAAAGEGHIFSSSLNQSDPRTVSAALAFEASRKSQEDIDKAFAAAGIDLLSKTINRSSTTANTLDTKVAYIIDELKSADSLDPNRTFTLTIEVDNVDHAMTALRGVETDPVKEIDFSTNMNTARESRDRTSGHIVLDSPTAKTATILAAIRDLGGIERDSQVAKNAQVPETRFSKDRIDLTLISRPTIVSSDEGLWPTVRAALSSASGALIYSLYLVLTGLMFIAPFALIIWPLWKLMKRRKTAV